MGNPEKKGGTIPRIVIKKKLKLYPGIFNQIWCGFARNTECFSYSVISVVVLSRSIVRINRLTHFTGIVW